MKNLTILIAAFTLLVWPLNTSSAWAAEEQHQEEEAHDAHDTQEDHSHEDGHEHNDHGEKTASHDDHGHESHENEDEHDSHGHGHDEHGHEEGKTEIAPETAKQAGIEIEKAGPVLIGKVIPLTGRITINENAKASVRARFPGIVREVWADLGETVKKGQVLAIVENNESLKEYEVTAPIDGVILTRNTNIGDVANGEPLFMLADLSAVWAKFHIFPKDAEFIEVGQNVRVHTLDEKKQAQALIKMLFPTADELSQTTIAIAVLTNENGQWKPGMTVEGDVIVSQAHVPLAVKTSAIQTMEGRTVVFVEEEGRYEAKPVRTGRTDGKYIEITHGLEPGASYVSENSFLIKADILKAGAEHSH